MADAGEVGAARMRLHSSQSVARRACGRREWGDQLELFGSNVCGGDGDSLGDLQSVMWDCDDMLLVLFDYYASLGSDGRISSMTFNEWGM